MTRRVRVKGTVKVTTTVKVGNRTRRTTKTYRV